LRRDRGKGEPSGVYHEADADKEWHEAGASAYEREHVLFVGLGKTLGQHKQKDYCQPDCRADDALAQLPHTPLSRRFQEFFDLRQHILDYLFEVAVFLNLSDSVSDGPADFFAGTGSRARSGVGLFESCPDRLQLGPTGTAILAVTAILSGAVWAKHGKPHTTV
jgi:hypothetical protein